MMTLERMKKIYKLAMSRFGEYRKHMRAAEIDEVNTMWDTLNGHSSFSSAFHILMKEKENELP